MRAFWTAFVAAYHRWRFVEDTESSCARDPGQKTSEAPPDELARLREAISRERRNLKSYRRFECQALAGPCEASIRAMESRLHALELQKAI